MRILFVAPYVPSLIRVRSYNFLRELSRRHEVTVLATDSGRGLADAEKLGAFCRAVHLEPLRKTAILRSCALAAARGVPLQAAFCQSPEFETRLADLVATEEFDLVHVEHLRAAHLAPLIPPGMASVFDSVDCISLLHARTLASSHSLKQRIVAAAELHRTRAYEGRVLREFDRVVATSSEDAQALISLAPGSTVTVVPNGVDLEYFHTREGQAEADTLLFSGKMSYHANVTALLHFIRNIFPLVRARRPEVRLRVVGSSPPAAVRALAKDPSISVTGYLPDIRGEMGRAAVALCPVTVKVGIQNKLLEAMAMGLSAVSTWEGVQGLAVEPGRDLLVAGSAVEFADHVCRLLADPSLRQQIGGAARRYVEAHHRWDDATSKLEAIYAEAAGDRWAQVLVI